MMINSITPGDCSLLIRWENGRTSEFPYIYLKDNAPEDRHVNGQKLVETSRLEADIRPQGVWLSPSGDLVVEWEGGGVTGSGEGGVGTGGDISVYSLEWLLEFDLAEEAITRRRERRKEEGPRRWWGEEGDGGLGGGDVMKGTGDAGFGGSSSVLPERDYKVVSNNDKELAEWLGYVQAYGFAILRNVPPEPGMVLSVIGLFGYVRETNYGKLFDVRTVVNPSNLAFTGLAISPHTDNPYRDPVPTLQLLHCLSSDAGGGDSILVDGLAVATELRSRKHRYFELLSRVPVRYRYCDAHNWLEYTTPLIRLRGDGEIEGIRLNNRSVQPFELDAATMIEFYDAYLYLVRMIDEPRYQVQFKMNAGDLYIVDNERVLHARSAYDNTGGERWLQGAYSDRDGLLSRWRVLRRSRRL